MWLFVRLWLSVCVCMRLSLSVFVYLLRIWITAATRLIPYHTYAAFKSSCEVWEILHEFSWDKIVIKLICNKIQISGVSHINAFLSEIWGITLNSRMKTARKWHLKHISSLEEDTFYMVRTEDMHKWWKLLTFAE